MQANTIDLVVFCAPSALALCLEGTPFIYTVWDLNHQERLEFPEVGRLDERQVRDAIHGAAVRGAFAVLADSPELIAGLTRSFGVPPGRMVELPFSTPAYLSSGGEDGPAVARWYGLPERLIFYPAQFWPHKNHVRLLQALALLRARSADLHLVLAGSDKGNLKHVKAEAARLNVADRVRWLGFVPDDHMRGLYEACSVVAMPSYFGPTNIPPLEAWLMRRPLVYSSHLAAHTGSAALYADADDPNEWADQILRALDPEVASRLVAAGVEQLQRQQDRRAQGLAEVTDRLARLARRRETWPR
jgi:glycosyltransferase involved in cell wall biosynthesis